MPTEVEADKYRPFDLHLPVFMTYSPPPPPPTPPHPPAASPVTTQDKSEVSAVVTVPNAPAKTAFSTTQAGTEMAAAIPPTTAAETSAPAITATVATPETSTEVMLSSQSMAVADDPLSAQASVSQPETSLSSVSTPASTADVDQMVVPASSSASAAETEPTEPETIEISPTELTQDEAAASSFEPPSAETQMIADEEAAPPLTSEALPVRAETEVTTAEEMSEPDPAPDITVSAVLATKSSGIMADLASEPQMVVEAEKTMADSSEEIIPSNPVVIADTSLPQTITIETAPSFPEASVLPMETIAVAEDSETTVAEATGAESETFSSAAPVVAVPPHISTSAETNPGPATTVEVNSTTEATVAAHGASLKSVEIIDSDVFSTAEIESITAPYLGQPMSQQLLDRLTTAVTTAYGQAGYVTSRVVVAADTDGHVHLRTLEGTLEQIEVTGNNRLPDTYIQSRLALGTETPLNINRIEDQLQLLQRNPRFETVTAQLEPGTTPGTSVLQVTVEETNPFNPFASIDDYASPNVGSLQTGLGMNYRDILFAGDTLSASYNRSLEGGQNAFDIGYQVPVNPMEGTLRFRVAPNRSKLIAADARALDIRSEADTYEVGFRQPLIRTPRQEFALGLGFRLQNERSFVFDDIPFPFGFGPDSEGKTRTRVVQFTQDYQSLDTQGAWGLRSQFNLGTGWLNATQNSDPIPDGQFFSWNGQVQRVQWLNPQHTLVIRAEMQLTPNELLSSEQFTIGGVHSVRGYRQDARRGDNGVQLSVEDRITLQRDAAGAANLLLIPFVDVGSVWNTGNDPNPQPPQQFLAGAGLGVEWKPWADLTARLDYGLPLVTIERRSGSLQDSGFYFRLGYDF